MVALRDARSVLSGGCVVGRVRQFLGDVARCHSDPAARSRVAGARGDHLLEKDFEEIERRLERFRICFPEAGVEAGPLVAAARGRISGDGVE